MSKLQQAVKELWTELMSGHLTVREAMSKIYDTYSNYPGDDVDYAIYTAANKDQKTEVVKYFPIRDVTYDEDNPLFDCSNKNEEGVVIDPITLVEIEEGNLVSYTSGGKKYCFDVLSVYQHITRSGGRPLNPLTREPLPHSFVEEVNTRVEKSRTVTVNPGNLSVMYLSFTTYGEFVIDILRATGSVVDALVSFDLVCEYGSLYSNHLESVIDKEIDEVTLVRYTDTDYRDANLSTMFAYTSSSSGEIYKSITLFIGSFAKIVPVYYRRDDMRVDPMDTLADVIHTALRDYGFDKWQEMDVVLDNGASLYYLTLTDRAIEVIPGKVMTVVKKSRTNQSIAEVYAKLESIALRHRELAAVLKRPTFEDLLNGLGYGVKPWNVEDYLPEKAGVLVKKMLRTKVDKDDSRWLWRAIKSSKADVYADVVSIPLSEINPDIDWDEYIRVISRGTGGVTPTMFSLATGFIQGKLPNRVSIDDIARLDSADLLKTCIDNGLVPRSSINLVLDSVKREYERREVSVLESKVFRRYALPPVVPGVNVVINREDTVGSVIIKILSVVGYAKWDTFDITATSTEGSQSLFNMPPYSCVMEDMFNSTVEIVKPAHALAVKNRERIMHNLVLIAKMMDAKPVLDYFGTKPSQMDKVGFNNIVNVVTDFSTLVDYITSRLKSQTEYTDIVPLIDLLSDHDSEMGYPDMVRGILRNYPLDAVNPYFDWNAYFDLMDMHRGSYVANPAPIREYIRGRVVSKPDPQVLAHLDCVDYMQKLIEAGLMDESLFYSTMEYSRELNDKHDWNRIYTRYSVMLPS